MWVINHQNFLCTKRICFINPHNLWLHLNNSGNLQRAWRRWCQVCHQLRLPQQQWGLHSQVWRSYDRSKFRLWKANTRQTSFGMGWLKNLGYWIGGGVLWSRKSSSEQITNNKDLKQKTKKNVSGLVELVGRATQELRTLSSRDQTLPRWLLSQR